MIVGAGSAGCALAYRLSENPALRVALLEAGPRDDSFMIRIPLGFPGLFNNPKYDWRYQTEPYATRPETPPVWTRGRMLGGSSSLNGMVYVRGAPEDYDGWEALGNPGWGWREVLPVYRAMENHELGADTMRGAGGPLDITCTHEPNALCDAWIDAAVQAGLLKKDDLNREEQLGAGYFQRTIKDGRRVSAATAFLARCKERCNLTVMTGTLATRVLFAGRRAAGVECLRDGTRTRLRATREVILSSGTIASPQILQLSGIGPGAHLQSLGIEVLHDAPGVGGNLQEHFYAGASYSVRRGSLNAEMCGPNLLKNLLRYLVTKQGPMAMSAAQVGAFAKTRPGLGRANAQWHMTPLMVDAGDRNRDERANKQLKVSKIGGFTSFGYRMQPTPNGDVMICSPDPAQAPRIRYNHLSSAEDQQTMIEIIRLTRKIAMQPALKDYIIDEILPGPQVQNDEALLDYAHRYGSIGYHPVGTCKMGHDSLAVVDHELRVHGVHGLRVIDASVIPVMPSGNTNAPAMMIGYKLGRMLLDQHKNHR